MEIIKSLVLLCAIFLTIGIVIHIIDVFINKANNNDISLHGFLVAGFWALFYYL